MEASRRTVNRQRRLAAVNTMFLFATCARTAARLTSDSRRRLPRQTGAEGGDALVPLL